MIEFIEGRVKYFQNGHLVISCGGVGYGVDVSSRFNLEDCDSKSEDSDSLSLWIYTHVKEDQLRLYGFSSRVERDIFVLTLSVNGVGPRVAIALQSNLDVGEYVEAILAQDVKTISRTPGVGPKQSQKIILELQPKIEKMLNSGQLDLGHIRAGSSRSRSVLGATLAGNVEPALMADVKLALTNLGYKPKEIDLVLGKVVSDNSKILGELSQDENANRDSGIELLLKDALRQLTDIR